MRWSTPIEACTTSYWARYGPRIAYLSRHRSYRESHTRMEVSMCYAVTGTAGELGRLVVRSLVRLVPLPTRGPVKCGTAGKG